MLHLNVVTCLLISLTGGASSERACGGKWVGLANIPNTRQEHGVTIISNTTVVAVGGTQPAVGGSLTTNLMQLYDVASDTWKTASPVPFKVNHPNVAAKDDKVYVLGGLVDVEAGSAKVDWIASGLSYVYDVAEDVWTSLPSMPPGTERGSAIVGVHRELIYVAGGMTVLDAGHQDVVDTVLAFNTTSDLWQRLPSPAAKLPQGKQHAAGTVFDNKLYMFGGRQFAHNDPRNTTYSLDLTNVSAGWKSLAHSPTARGGISGGAINGVFYTFGGEGNPDSITGVFNQTEAFDMSGNKWTRLPIWRNPRHGTQAASGNNGCIYIPGGGLQEDGKKVVNADGKVTFANPTNRFDAYCAGNC